MHQMSEFGTPPIPPHMILLSSSSSHSASDSQRINAVEIVS